VNARGPDSKQRPATIGSHDVGGRRGYGPIEIDGDQRPLHHEWEGRMIGLTLTTMLRGLIQVDRWRARQEELHPVVYAELPYFERWLYSVERNLVLEGVLGEDEIEARMQSIAAAPERPLPENDDPEFDRAIEALIEQGGPVVKEAPDPPRYGVGDAVQLREIAITAPGDQHTRLPGYAQGHRGRIEQVHPAQDLPDAMVARRGEVPEHTYAVRLDAADLWPDAEPNATVCVDAWESYLEPAPTSAERT